MNKFEIDPNKKTIKIISKIGVYDIFNELGSIENIHEYTVIPNETNTIERGAPFDEKLD